MTTTTINYADDDTMRALNAERVAALVLPEGVTVAPVTRHAVVLHAVRRYGVQIGEVTLGERTSNALPTGVPFATYRFATPQDAVDAVISYEVRGYWRNEL